MNLCCFVQSLALLSSRGGCNLLGLNSERAGAFFYSVWVEMLSLSSFNQSLNL